MKTSGMAGQGNFDDDYCGDADEDLDKMLETEREIREEEGEEEEEEILQIVRKKPKKNVKKTFVKAKTTIKKAKTNTKKANTNAKKKAKTSKYVAEEASCGSSSSMGDEGDDDERESDKGFIDDDSDVADAHGPMPFMPSESEPGEDDYQQDEYGEQVEDDYQGMDESEEDDSHGGVSFEQEKEELLNPLWSDPNNCNNVSGAMKVVSYKDLVKYSDIDGSMFGFVSESEGSSLSLMAKKQILMLLHVIHACVHKKHILPTENLDMEFSPRDGILEKITARVNLGYNAYAKAGTNEEDLRKVVNEIPHESVCDFREGALDSNCMTIPVDFAEILLAPVIVSFDDEHGPCKKMFWVVTLKTRRGYDFPGHLKSILTRDDAIIGNMRKINKARSPAEFSDYLSWLTSLVREVFLFCYRNSPNASAFFKMQVNNPRKLYFIQKMIIYK